MSKGTGSNGTSGGGGGGGGGGREGGNYLNLEQATKQNIAKIQEKFNESKEFSKTSHFQGVKVWEKGENVRLYVPRNAYEQAGYINLKTGTLHPSRPGNIGKLENVLEYIKKL